MIIVSRSELEQTVGHISQIALKHWLKVNEYQHTAGNTDDYYELLTKLIVRGNLSLDTLRSASLEIEENGGKRIYLRKFKSSILLHDRTAFTRHLRNRKLSLANSPNISIRTPNTPSVNYIYWSEQGIRIKATETHIKLDINLEKRAIIENKVTKFALAILDFNSGFMQIRLDAPDDIHSYKNSSGESDPQAYEAYYFKLFKDLLGIQDPSNFDLGGVAEHIVNLQPRIFRLPVELVRTGANSRQRYSCRDDVRDDPARQAAAVADSANWVYEDISGYWIAGQSHGALQRDVFMQLKRKPSMVRFLADCLASEVDYALSQIRNLSS